MNPQHIPSVDVEPIEDTNPFITKHAILKTTGASYSHSVFSASINGRLVPNRDYPYEGLTTIINNENWKFLDGIAVGLLQDGAPLALTPTTVTIRPGQHIFRYVYKTGVLEASYMLDSPLTADGVVCYLTLLNKTDPQTSATMPEESGIQIVAEPLFDIRHMYAQSEPGACEISHEDGVLLVKREGHAIGLRFYTADNSTNPPIVHADRRVYDWWYKLGSGYRTCGDDNCPHPSGEGKQMLSAGDIIFNGGDTQIVIVIACSNSAQAVRKLLDTAPLHTAVEEQNRYYAQEVKRKLMTASASSPDAMATSQTTDVLFRTLGMLSFGMRLQDSILHEAGDFWFKNVWFRDEFEGLLSNFDTLFALGHHGYIKNAVEKALEYQDTFGRVPNHIPTRADDEISYNSADATLLTFIAGGRYIKRIQEKTHDRQDSGKDKDKGDEDDNADAETFIHTVLKGALQMVSAFSTNTNTPNGAPVLQDDGLIAVAAWHSWTDCNYYDKTCGARLPIRTLRLEGLAPPEYDLPQFLLPEINAQWICALLHIRDMCDMEDIGGAGYQYHMLKDRVNEILKKAMESYRVVFYNKDNGFLYNCVFKDQRDPTLGSPGVVAMSLLSESTDMFSGTQVRDFCMVTRSRLMAFRNGEPFGVLVREGADVYYNDDQYHMAVTWPRDTPYLLRLFRAAGMMDDVKDILENNLVHQMDEGFVGYNSELFSIDPTGLTPVKNPVQWWSQWCDEFLK